MKDLERVVEGAGNSTNCNHEAALRSLFMLSLDPDICFTTKVNELIALGCETLGLPLGIVSRIKGTEYRVQYASNIDWAPQIGTTFDLSRTYCTHTIAANDVQHFHHARLSSIARHPCYLDFGLESYIGVPLTIDSKTVGTLNFSAPEARGQFSVNEVELVRLFGRWLGEEWSKSERAKELAHKTMILNAIVEAVPDALVTVNEMREIQMANSAAGQIFGYSQDELIGKTSALLYPSKKQYELFGERLYRKAELTTVGSFEMELVRKDGQTFPGDVFLAPLRNNEGAHLGVVGVLRDITDQKALKQAREELIATVSHELRTPITSANGALKLLALERSKLSPAMQPTLDIATRNLDRLVLLVEDILTCECASAKKATVNLRPLEIGTLLQRAAGDILPFANQSSVTISVVDADVSNQNILGDQHRLLQVLSNLISNAIKASAPGAAVEIGARPNGLGFWVRDHGKGIPDSLKACLFERFSHSAEGYVEGQGGTGLGMGIVKAIIEQHGGEITFETLAGKGTEFCVSLRPA